MKAINLLNKIANKEEVPKKIKYNNKIYHYGYHYQWYLTDNLCEELFIDKNHLNDEIEIIEDTPKEEVQVLSRWYPPTEDKKIEKLDTRHGISLVNCVYKIDEIIDRLNGE